MKDAGLMLEWNVFAALVVDYLSMTKDVMILYEDKKKWHKKALRIMENILTADNKGRVSQIVGRASLFPRHVVRFMPGILFYFNCLKVREMISGHKFFSESYYDF